MSVCCDLFVFIDTNSLDSRIIYHQLKKKRFLKSLIKLDLASFNGDRFEKFYNYFFDDFEEGIVFNLKNKVKKLWDNISLQKLICDIGLIKFNKWLIGEMWFYNIKKKKINYIRNIDSLCKDYSIGF